MKQGGRSTDVWRLRWSQHKGDIISAVVLLAALAIVLVFAARSCADYPRGPSMRTTEGPTISTTAHTAPQFGHTVSAWGGEPGTDGPEDYQNDSGTLFAGDNNQRWVMFALPAYRGR